MEVSRIPAVLFPTLLLLGCFVLSLVKFLQKFWWTPIRLRKAMEMQGVRGPPYRFIYGNTKEILQLREDSFSRPMENLSHNMLARILPHLHSWIRTYGKEFVFWFGPRPFFMTMESELIKEVTNNRNKAFPKDELPEHLKRLLGDGLFSTEGEKWVKLRKISNHSFHAESLKNMIPAMVESVEMLLGRWKQHEGKEIEVHEEFKLLTSEVISRTAFGSSYVEGQHIFEMLMKLAVIASRNAFKIRLPGLRWVYKKSDDVEAEKLERGIRESIVRIMKKREEEAMGGINGFGNDFLGLLLKANHNDDGGYKVTTEDLVDECKTFYFAGQETTASLLSWTVLLLAIHADWQDKARQEVLQLFGQQLPNAEGISRMKMMNMIINETLRLYPPVTSISRVAKQDVKLGELSLKAGTAVNIPVLALHHDTEIWGDDANVFNPERFSEGVAKATNNNPMAFLPFGLGPRTCVGMNFATNEAKIALSMVLQKWSFTLSPAYIHSPVVVLTVRPLHGVQLLLHNLECLA